MRRSLPDEERAALLALLQLDGMGPNRLRWLLQEYRSPSEAVAAVATGGLLRTDRHRPRGLKAALVERWSNQIRRIDGTELLDDHRRLGIDVLAPDDPDWPFHRDPEPPALLFVAGDVNALHHPLRAGVVGTRRCSSVGRRVAREFGADLTATGVSVVSGLALGIDGSAHLGALTALSDGADAAKPIGVVAGGLDQVYPPKHADLWRAVIAHGVLVSETPLGMPPARWRFPARNRLIAGLSDVLVVVESHARGGALLTVDEAAGRGVPVLAVPGSVLAASSAGTNALLLDGCAPVRTASDVTDLLGLSTQSVASDLQTRGPGGAPVQLDLGLAGQLVQEVAGGPVHVDALVAATGCSLSEVLRTTRQLFDEGRVALDGSWVSPAATGDR